MGGVGPDQKDAGAAMLGPGHDHLGMPVPSLVLHPGAVASVTLSSLTLITTPSHHRCVMTWLLLQSTV